MFCMLVSVLVVLQLVMVVLSSSQGKCFEPRIVRVGWAPDFEEGGSSPQEVILPYWAIRHSGKNELQTSFGRSWL